MNEHTQIQPTAMQLLERMFEVEMTFIHSGSDDVDALAEAFHPNVVVHEPASLPVNRLPSLTLDQHPILTLRA